MLGDLAGVDALAAGPHVRAVEHVDEAPAVLLGILGRERENAALAPLVGGG